MACVSTCPCNASKHHRNRQGISSLTHSNKTIDLVDNCVGRVERIMGILH